MLREEGEERRRNEEIMKRASYLQALKIYSDFKRFQRIENVEPERFVELETRGYDKEFRRAIFNDFMKILQEKARDGR